ncbi:MAG: hypothetical protein Roseis2KO_13490 [Roseivirga sp.]
MSGTTLVAQQEREEDREEEGDNPQARLDFEFLRTKDPKTGKIPQNIRALELAFMREQSSLIDIPYAAGDITSAWKNRGPFNVGGRTRALAVDSRNENIILAGGVSGGMWRSTDQGATWQKATGTDELQSVTCIAQDPTSPDTWYYGTGEFSGNSASGSGAFFLGDGIYKSTDNGATWVVLANTQSDTPESFDSNFDINMEMVVDPTNGDLYVATVGILNRSTDGGATFTEVILGSASSWVDVVVSSTGTLYAALDGDGIFRSTDGVNWTDITPASGFPLVSGERKELALASSNEDILYLIGEDADNSSGYSFWRFDESTDTWADRSSGIPQLGGQTGDFDSQGGYDLLIKVKPDDENFVVIGGTNLFRSTDGFATTGNTDWIGGYTPVNTNFGLYTDHHPDQHSFVFLSADRALSGNDGGVQITNDIESDLGAEAVDWVSLNNGYVTTQVYALSAGPGDQIMAGFQDNSTWLTISPASDAIWTDQFGGDGAYNAFNSDGTVRYMSSQRGNIFRVNYNQGANDTDADNFTDFAPINYSASLFIVPFYLDPADDDLFYLAGASEFYVNTQAGTGSAGVGWKSINLGTSGVVSEIGVSPANVVFAGTSNGELFKIVDPGGNESVTDISGSNFPAGYVSGVAVDPIDENSILVTFSNYGIPSVFYTSDGGVNWDDVSGNLEENTDGTGSGPSVRSATILGNGDKYFVGTSTGLYATTSLAGASVTWIQENPNGMGEVVVEHLVSRMSDGLVLAGTHGNGIYSANFEVTPPNDNDLGVVAITAPEEEILASASDAVSVSATIRNFGGLSQSSFDISFLVDDQEIDTETINQTIAPGEEVELTFSTTFDFSTAGTYSLKVGVALTGDENDTNDTKTLSVVSIAPIETFPYTENFDASIDFPSQWQVENSSLNWLINSGGTPSVETGPLEDNTSGEGNYAFTEASGVSFGDEALLVTPWLSISGMERPALEFYYHMFGFQMGDLEVLAIDSDDNVTPLVTISGQQQESQDDPFAAELIELDAFMGKEIRFIFQATVGTGFRSDIAIDDIRVFNIPLKDLAVTDIESPGEQVSGEAPVIIEVTNLGVEAQSGYEVSYSVNGQLVATETVPGTLASGASVSYPFTELYDFSETGGYELSATVSLIGDEDTTNDTYETVVTNLPFTGYYIMEQQAETSEGPSNQFGNGYLFDEAGISKVFITAESITLRTFDIRYFNYQNFSNTAVPITFDLNDNGDTEVTDQVFTGLSCSGDQVVLGPADSKGTYDDTDDTEFSLLIKEDIFESCQVGSSDANFVLTKVPPVNEADSLALIALYNSTNGPGWNRPWDLQQPASFWEGVVVTSSGRVVGLVLEDNNLDGTLPTEIGDLSALRGLVLGGNELRGGLPAELGNLTELEALILRDNDFGGSIPVELANLTKLFELNLAINNLTGGIPTELGALTLLQTLSLNSNELTGEIPPGLSALTDLRELGLGSNGFTGSLPAELSALTNLELLDISENDLSGEIPGPFNLLTNLDEIFINDNNISGLPDLSALEPSVFNADFNNLDFGDLLPNINILDQYVPQGDIGDPLNLVGMAGQDLNLQTITSDDGGNKYQWFKDDVLINGATNSSYQFTYTGTADEGLYRCDVTNDGVPGLTLSRFITVIDQTVTQREDYAALEAFFNATGGANWVNKTNWLTSVPFDQWVGVSTDIDDRVTGIELVGNNLRNELPEDVGDLAKLETIDLSGNFLEGELPASLWNLTSLVQIDFDDNSLSGELPTQIANLVNLEELYLGGNSFSGSIPDEIGALTKLKDLTLDDNELTGTLPVVLGDLIQLVYLELNDNNFEGELPAELGQLTNLDLLNVNDNNLEGSLPVELGNLTNLTELRLFDNDFSGEIPNALGNLTALTDLEIEGNNLTGSVPATFSSLVNLVTLNLYENELSGLPDLSALAVLATFRVDDNNLNFSDILPNIDLLTNYQPQAEVDDPAEEVVNQSAAYTMEVSDDTGGNVYQWYRNDEPIDGANERTYIIADFQVVNEGTYSCEITNPNAPDLTLYRNPIELSINYSPTAITIDNSSVAENESIGTLVGTLSVEDIDLEDEYEWVLSGTDAASFSLNDNLLNTAAAFDFETTNSFDITISVKDKGGLTAQVDFTITVTNVNEVPVLVTAIDDQSANEDAAFELTLLDGMFTDEDGDYLVLSVAGLPAGLTFDEATSKISGTPLQAGVGVSTVTVTATDPSDATATDSFDLTIVNVNDAPVVVSEQADVTTDEDAPFEYTIPDGTFSDEDEDDLTLSVSGLPASLSFDAATGKITGTPLQADVAVHTIEVTATDPSSAAITDSFELTISNVNDAPVLAAAQSDQTADEDAALAYQIPAGTFTDEDGDALTLAVSGLPSTLSFDAGTGMITGTPLAADIGTYTIEVSATDPDNASATDSFELTVSAVNDAPVLVTELPDVQTDRDAPFELVIDPANVTDEEGDAIAISASGLPASLSITDGTISGTPVLGENGDFTVTITYSDGNGGSVTDSFVLTVNLVTSIEEEKEFGRISIQPNPFVNEIRVLVEKGLFGQTQFSLQPVGGKSVWSSNRNLTGQTELTLQINKPVAEGIYLLIVMPEGKSPIVRKVIKKE